MRPTSLTCLIVLGLAALTQTAVAGHDRSKKTCDTVDEMIVQLLTARDDDDREDAAEALGEIASDARALEALEYAAEHDRDGGVRKDARKAAERVRARILAERLTDGRTERKVVIVEQPPRTVVVPSPTVVYRPLPTRPVVVVQPRVQIGRVRQVGRPQRLNRVVGGRRVVGRGRVVGSGRVVRGGGLSIGFSFSF